MGKREDYISRLEPLISDPSKYAELEAMLLSNSYLPGPAANLELSYAFADCFEGAEPSPAQWELLERWLVLMAGEAPVNDPREFLPFCALQAMGTFYVRTGAQRKEQILDHLRSTAGDPRWRIREGVAMGFQRIGERDFEAVKGVFSDWIGRASSLERRAMVAALAHPPMLKQPDRVRYCLLLSDKILAELSTAGKETRRTEEFRVLRQALEYAISVFVAHLPEEGFAFLQRWAREDDPDIKRIVRTNLGKGRLKKYSGEVAETLAML